MKQMNPFEKIRTKFFWRRSFPLPDGQLVAVAVLLREEDWRPLDAPWWHEKQASIIGADIDGNFFLRRCDGSVRYWDHKANANIVVATSVKEFARRIVEGNEDAVKRP